MFSHFVNSNAISLPDFKIILYMVGRYARSPTILEKEILISD
jgi:hypothetical protein